jgi:Peptidase C65 Otubain
VASVLSLTLAQAVVFGYFENLLSEDLDKIASERARLQTFNDTLVAVGYEFTMVELFVDETLALFDSLHEAIESGNRSDRLLLDIFNDENRSNSIVFHFKVRFQSRVRKKKVNSDKQ